MLKITVLILSLAALVGCETVAGVGQDVSNGARAMKRAF